MNWHKSRPPAVSLFEQNVKKSPPLMKSPSQVTQPDGQDAWAADVAPQRWTVDAVRLNAWAGRQAQEELRKQTWCEVTEVLAPPVLSLLGEIQPGSNLSRASTSLWFLPNEVRRKRGEVFADSMIVDS
jgi:hypothetical protein